MHKNERERIILPKLEREEGLIEDVIEEVFQQPINPPRQQLLVIQNGKTYLVSAPSNAQVKLGNFLIFSFVFCSEITSSRIISPFGLVYSQNYLVLHCSFRTSDNGMNIRN